jgi:quinoprotein glucose dehydrogenase
MMTLRASTLAAVLVAAVALGAQSTDNTIVEWPYYGADLAGSRYSPLADINRANVGRLQVVWEWRPPDKPMPEYNAVPGSFNTTPLMIDNVLYLSTPFGRVAALEADTGRELWVYDPEVYRDRQALTTGWNHRGVAAWRDRNNLRILVAAKHRLISLDGKTGKPDTRFGRKGEIDLTDELRWQFDKQLLSNLSAPVVYKDLVIVGSGIGDRLMFKNDPPGVVRAYNVRTGRNIWDFYVVPRPPEFGHDTWGNESWANTGHANVWAAMAVDTERGLLYLPTSTPSNDFYGGRRPGANLFAESLVCLDAATGERKWHFQAVHHGLWDYDFGSQPTLGTITVNGRRIDAVAQVSKQGFTYVFDRVTGQPVWPIEERRVPTDTDVPGEHVYPTQPFPTKPPPFALQGFDLEDAFDLTPELKAAAQAEIKKYRYGPLFTPPTLQGTLIRPRISGGANWGGAAFDPETGLLYVRSSDIVQMLKLGKRESATLNPFVLLSDAEYVGGSYNLGAGGDTFMGGLPLSKPPYAHLTAIDLNRGEFAWRVPFGKGSDAIRAHPALKGVSLPARLGTPGASGAIVTKGGLVFIGGGDAALYAFDKATGMELSQHTLPRRTSGTPMTYRARSGRQFVVIATGSVSDTSLVALALPE